MDRGLNAENFKKFSAGIIVNTMLGKIVTFPIHGDDRGSLIALENHKDYPFDVRRVYYIFGTVEGVRRGFHAHKHLQQILICVSGSCMVHLDNGKGETEEIALDNPQKGLYIANDLWREMYDFSPDAVLMVLASEFYDESDYIRDYQAFVKYVRGE